MSAWSSSAAFEYDVAISFAGEERPEAEAIAACLRRAGLRVFYDAYEQAGLWGKDLYTHLANVYQRKARYCLMLVSAAYATKVWTNHERKSAQARALSESGEYLLPVRFDDTEIPGLLPTVSYVRFAEYGAEGICSLLLEKFRGGSDLSVSTINSSVPHDESAYVQQRKLLPDTEIMDRIWTMPRWRIWIRPTVFKPARFQDLADCRSFMASASVEVPGWYPYPWVVQDALQSGDEWVAGEINFSDGRVRHLERWALFRSGQFVHNCALDVDPQLGNRVHVLQVLDITTAAMVFAERMARRRILTEVALTFEMHSVDGRTLTWPQDISRRYDAVPGGAWAQDKTITAERTVNPAEFGGRKRGIALEIALEFYAGFGWNEPDLQRLTEEQERRFGNI